MSLALCILYYLSHPPPAVSQTYHCRAVSHLGETDLGGYCEWDCFLDFFFSKLT